MSHQKTRKSISDELDEIYQQNGYNLTQEVGKDESVVWFTLKDFLKAKQAILAEIDKAIADELAQLLDSQIIKPEYHNGIVTKIKELRGEYGKT